MEDPISSSVAIPAFPVQNLSRVNLSFFVDFIGPFDCCDCCRPLANVLFKKSRKMFPGGDLIIINSYTFFHAIIYKFVFNKAGLDEEFLRIFRAIFAVPLFEVVVDRGHGLMLLCDDPGVVDVTI